LVIAILRVLAEAAVNDSKKEGIGAIVACVLMCCIRCIEDIISYLNKNAYAYMAICGENYCTSAWNGFLNNLKHAAKFYFAVSLANVLIFLGILCITGLSLGTFLLFARYAFEDGKYISLFAPAVAASVIAFLIASLFLSVFDEAVLATVQCYAVDCDLNDGVPKWGPASYQDALLKIFDEDKVFP